MNKNDEFEVEITDIGNDGEGIGRHENMAFFIKGAIIGDRILAGVTKLKKTYGYARLIKIIAPSPSRTNPTCTAASRCGGCQFQNMTYEKQLEYKENKVRECLVRLGGISPERFEGLIEFNKIIAMENPRHYRNKAQFPVGVDKNGQIAIGFYAGHTHSIVDINACEIQHEVNDYLIQAVRQYIIDEQVSIYDEEKHSGLVRHILTRVGYTTGEVMVCIIINGNSLPKKEALIVLLQDAIGRYNVATKTKLKLHSVSINTNLLDTNVIMGEKTITIFGEPYITDYIDTIKYRISPLSFFQVNPVQTKALYSTALDYADITGNEIVWDIYCGIGTISLFLAQRAKQVYGVEIVPQAIEDAKENARLNNITNAEFFVGAAEEILPQKYAENPDMHADVIVVDPPRKGCDEALLSTIIKLSPKRIVYVSCDPATLARDVKYLGEQGYELKRVQPCDMFPMSKHVESVCLLSKLNGLEVAQDEFILE